MIKLYNGDCLEVMKELPDGSIDLILCDPPYGTMTNFGKSKLAKEIGYKDCSWDVALDNSILFPELSRVLRQNGKAILFVQEPFTSKLITETIANLPFSYRAIWKKESFGNKFMCNKAMLSLYEDIVIFSKCGHDYAGENPNREYFKRVLDYIGFNSAKDINKALGHRRAEHCFYVTGKRKVLTEVGGKADHVCRIGSTQFALCTEETYNELIEKFNINSMEGFKNFSELLEIENAYKNKYASTFNLWQGKAFKSNVLEYKKDNDGYHPTQKPVLLLEDLIKTFSNEGDTVLDFTMGSGSTGVACKNTNRSFIGIELDKNYFNIAKQRINEASEVFAYTE